MAANHDKVEEKTAKELNEKIKAGESHAEIAEPNPNNVAYKIKDKTDKSL